MQKRVMATSGRSEEWWVGCRVLRWRSFNEYRNSRVYEDTALSAMSCVDSSVVSSSAFFVLASSAIRPFFLSISRRRYFSSSLLGIRAARAVVLGIENALLFHRRPLPIAEGDPYRTRDHNRVI